MNRAAFFGCEIVSVCMERRCADRAKRATELLRLLRVLLLLRNLLQLAQPGAPEIGDDQFALAVAGKIGAQRAGVVVEKHLQRGPAHHPRAARDAAVNRPGFAGGPNS